MSSKSFIVFLAILSLVAGCKPRKNSHKKAPEKVVVKVDSTIAEPDANDILSFTLKSWTYFSSKVEIEFDDGSDKKKFNANIRMYKDSLIWISAGLFGMEGMRIMINEDSVVVLNKLDKTYTVLKNNAFQSISDIPLTVTQIQNLLLAKPVYTLKLYQILLLNETRLIINYPQERFVTSHNYQKQFYTIDTTSIRDKFSVTYAEARYSDYAEVNKHNFPYTTAITASNGQKRYNIRLSYSDVDFETIQSFPFTIPSSYEKSK